MSTFLTTPKMHPDLAARIEASVTGRPVRSKMSPKVVAILRFGGIVGFIGIVVWLFVVRRRAADALEADRNALLAQFHEITATTTDADKAISSRIEVWVGAHSGAYEGDLVDASVQGAGMATTLRRPMLYLRGPLEGFKSVQGLADMGQTTYRDAFVLCLLEPPEKATEKTLRDASKAATAGGDRVKVAAHIARYHTARAGMVFLAPQWEERVKTVSDSRELTKLRTQLQKSSLAESVEALKGRLLLAVMDEPKDGNGPTEIDGANRHYVRVIMYDLDADKVLLRKRTLVDPYWIPTNRRGEYANGMISCELGMEIRAAMSGTPAPARE